MRLFERYYDVLEVMGGRAKIPDMLSEMRSMGWHGYTSASAYRGLKRLRVRGKVRLMRDGYYVTDKWLKNQEENFI